MTDPRNTPAPAEQAAQQAGTTALAEDHVAPTHFIPQATQDNYAQIARDQAEARDVEPRQVMQELGEQFEQLHERQPLDGYDHLAAWAKEFDPAVGGSPSGLAILQARALESARRDPYQAIIGDQALVEQAVLSQQAADEGKVGSTSAPTIDPSSGFLPNPGPLPAPEGTPTSADRDREREQQQSEQSSTPPASSTEQPPTPPPPSETTPPPKARNGGTSGSTSG